MNVHVAGMPYPRSLLLGRWTQRPRGSAFQLVEVLLERLREPVDGRGDDELRREVRAGDMHLDRVRVARGGHDRRRGPHRVGDAALLFERARVLVEAVGVVPAPLGARARRAGEGDRSLLRAGAPATGPPHPGREVVAQDLELWAHLAPAGVADVVDERRLVA